VRYSPIKFSVRDRDLGSTVEEAQTNVGKKVELPWGTTLTWSGQINELKEAMSRLVVISTHTAAHRLSVIAPSRLGRYADCRGIDSVAITGGLLALLVTHINFSISAAMGFISIFGIAVQDAILVVTYFQRLRDEGRSLVDAAREPPRRDSGRC